MLIRRKRPVKLESRVTSSPTVVHYYKLLPRTIKLIRSLSARYGDNGMVLAACVEVLRDSPSP